MKRRVLFTEDQLKEILGEETFNGIYMDATSTGTEFPTWSYSATDGEVSDTEPVSDEENGEPFMTDKYGKEKVANSYWLRNRGNNYSLYEGKKKRLNERNKMLDGKKIFSIPDKLKKYAVDDGIHNEIMQHLRSDDKLSIDELYRMRNELQDSDNERIKRGIDNLIKMAQVQGSSLRGFQDGLTQARKTGKQIYYDTSTE